MLLEAHEEHLIRQLRTPLERDDLEKSLQRISEHEVRLDTGAIFRYTCKFAAVFTLTVVLHWLCCRRRPPS